MFLFAASFTDEMDMIVFILRVNFTVFTKIRVNFASILEIIEKAIDGSNPKMKITFKNLVMKLLSIEKRSYFVELIIHLLFLFSKS